MVDSHSFPSRAEWFNKRHSYAEYVIVIWEVVSIHRRMVINQCLGVDVAESEDEKFGVVYAVEFSPERLDFRID